VYGVMDLTKKVIGGLTICNQSAGMSDSDCGHCPYNESHFTKETDDGTLEVDFSDDACFNRLNIDALNVIKAYGFAWEQFKSTLEELIENNDGDVKRISVFLFNLIRIRELDIREGKYI
jgi:hypothetical protein